MKTQASWALDSHTPIGLTCFVLAYALGTRSPKLQGSSTLGGYAWVVWGPPPTPSPFDIVGLWCWWPGVSKERTLGNLLVLYYATQHLAPYRRAGCQGQSLTGVLALRVSLGGESVRARVISRQWRTCVRPATRLAHAPALLMAGANRCYSSWGPAYIMRQAPTIQWAL